MSVDLHTHSRFSDGSDSPTELMSLAAESGLSAIALTDHDTVQGLDEAEQAAARFGIELIPGIELSLEYPVGTMHLLVLWVDQDGALGLRLSSLRDGRNTRNERILAALTRHGMDLTIEEVAAEAGDGSVGRPHIAAVMVRRGYVPDIRTAFDLWLGSGKPGYVDRPRLQPEEALAMARSEGGVPILAHPHTLGLTTSHAMSELLERLHDAGLVGLEAHYGAYRRHERDGYAHLARRFGLVPSGGSDYHGTYKAGLSLGMGYGDLHVGRHVLDELTEHRAMS